MKKKLIATIVTVVMAVAMGVTLSACTDNGGDKGYTGDYHLATAYGMVHNHYLGKATVVVKDDKSVAKIDFAEYLLPTQYAAKNVSFSALATGVTTPDKVADFKVGFVNYPKNYTLYNVLYISSRGNSVNVTAAPTYIGVAGRIFKIDIATDSTTGNETATYVELGDAPNKIEDLEHAILEETAISAWYAEACDNNEIVVYDVLAATTAGAIEVDAGVFVKALPAAANNAITVTEIETGTPTAHVAGASVGLYKANTTFNKMDADNTYWRGSNYPYGYEGNLKAVLEFFTKNGFGYTVTSATTGDILKASGAGTVWTVTAGGKEVASTDGTAKATLLDLPQYYKVMKEAYTAAADKVPA